MLAARGRLAAALLAALLVGAEASFVLPKITVRRGGALWPWSPALRPSTRRTPPCAHSCRPAADRATAARAPAVQQEQKVYESSVLPPARPPLPTSYRSLSTLLEPYSCAPKGNGFVLTLKHARFDNINSAMVQWLFANMATAQVVRATRARASALRVQRRMSRPACDPPAGGRGKQGTVQGPGAPRTLQPPDTPFTPHPPLARARRTSAARPTPSSSPSTPPTTPP
jgi:hypothetical protein